MRFRPLTGIVVLITNRKRHNDLISGSFRPLTGIVVLIDNCASDIEDAQKLEFPSPYGDCGSYLTGLRAYKYIVNKFPSPYGDCGSYLHPL